MKVRFLSIAVAAVLAAGSLCAAPVSETPATVVATTSWTAAFALAAGAESVHVLAPYELRHPPEYELSPGDLVTISKAEYLIFAGYEGMMPRVREAAGADGAELIQITTDFSPATIEASVGKIASILGTEAAGARSVAEILAFYESWRQEIAEAGFAKIRAITHAFHAPLAKALGAEVIGTFGPPPLEARQIVELSGLQADLIVDNYHNDVGKPLRETMAAVPVVEFINFPGVGGTRTLIDVLRENRKRLAAVMSEAR